MNSLNIKQPGAIWIILFVGLVLRISIPIVAVYLTPEDRSIFHNKDDTYSYVCPAIGLATQGKFVSDGKPETYRTPGYPLLLVPGVLLGDVELVTVGIQAILNCLTILLVFGIARCLFSDDRIALFSAGLYVFEPLSVIQTSILQTETAFAFTLAAFLFLLLRYLKNYSLSDLLAAGLVLSAGYYIRPAAYLMPLLVGVLLLIHAIIRTEFRTKHLIHVLLFLLVSMTPLFAWQLRNKVETGIFAFTPLVGHCAYFGIGANILALESGIHIKDQLHNMGYPGGDIYFSLHPEQREWSEVQVNNYQQKEGLKILAAHPFQFVRMFLVKAGWTLVGPGLSDWLYVFNVKLGGTDRVLENRKDALRHLKGPWLGLVGTVFLTVMLAVYWVLAAAGLFARKPGTHEGTIFLVIIAAYFVLVTAVSGTGYSRYRHPIMPIVCVFAGNGLAMVLDRWTSRRRVSSNA